WLACLGAALWGMSPLGGDTLDWYSAFGHVLVGTSMLLVLRSVVRLDVAGDRLPPRAGVRWVVLPVVRRARPRPRSRAALVFPVVLILLLPAIWRQPGLRLAFLALPAMTLAFYFGQQYLYRQIGTLSVEEQVHQQAALSGFGAIPLFWLHLLWYSSAGTILGFFMPQQYPSPAAGIALSALVAGTGLLLWRGDARTRRYALGVAALWGGVYPRIPIGSGRIYSLLSVASARAATAGRYRYAGTIPLAVLVCVVVGEAGHLPVLRAVPRSVAVVLLLALVLEGRHASGFRIDTRPYVHDYFLYTKQDLASQIAAAPRETPLY